MGSLARKQVVLHTPKPYLPRSTPPALVRLHVNTSHPRRQCETDSQSIQPGKPQKTILHRFLTLNGGVVFALGVVVGDQVIRDPDDVPFSQILRHVTADELQRFENKQYKDEDEQERVRLATVRGPGRPRKHPPANTSDPPVSRSQTPKDRAGYQSYAAFRQANPDGTPVKKRGRPVGWRKHKPHVPPHAPTAKPSFNGPQPTGDPSNDENSRRSGSESERESALDVQQRTGVYSMIAASGITANDSDAEMDTSRDISPAPRQTEGIRNATPPIQVTTPLRVDSPQKRQKTVNSASLHSHFGPQVSFDRAYERQLIEGRSTGEAGSRVSDADQAVQRHRKVDPHVDKADDEDTHESFVTQAEDQHVSKSLISQFQRRGSDPGKATTSFPVSYNPNHSPKRSPNHASLTPFMPGSTNSKQPSATKPGLSAHPSPARNPAEQSPLRRQIQDILNPNPQSSDGHLPRQSDDIDTFEVSSESSSNDEDFKRIPFQSMRKQPQTSPRHGSNGTELPWPHQVTNQVSLPTNGKAAPN